MIALVDTNILVYRYDPRYPEKQQKATDALRKGIEERSLRLPHQALVEFFAVVTRPIGKSPPLLSAAEAKHEIEDFFVVRCFVPQ